MKPDVCEHGAVMRIVQYEKPDEWRCRACGCPFIPWSMFEFGVAAAVRRAEERLAKQLAFEVKP